MLYDNAVSLTGDDDLYVASERQDDVLDAPQSPPLTPPLEDEPAEASARRRVRARDSRANLRHEMYRALYPGPPATESATFSDAGGGMRRVRSFATGDSDAFVREIQSRPSQGRPSVETLDSRARPPRNRRPRMMSSASVFDLRESGHGGLSSTRAARHASPLDAPSMPASAPEDRPLRTVAQWRDEVARNMSTVVPGAVDVETQQEVSVYWQGFNGGMHVGLEEAAVEAESWKRVRGTARTPPREIVQRREESDWVSRSESRNDGRAVSPRYRGTHERVDSLRSPMRRTFSSPLNPSTSLSAPRSSTPPRPHAPSPRARPVLQQPSPANTSSEPSAATRTSSLELRLASAHPPLLHLLPTLASLGVRTEEHLRAVARLRDGGAGCGYREVRAEALRLGVSVVEWAILLGSVGEESY